MHIGIKSCADSVSEQVKQPPGHVMPGIALCTSVPMILCASVGIRFQPYANHIYTSRVHTVHMFDNVMDSLEQKDACNTAATSVQHLTCGY